MSIADKIKGAVQGAAAEGAERAQALADSRKRSKLISELGELTYRKGKGEVIDETLVESIIAQLHELEEPDSPEESDAEVVDTEPGQPGVGGTATGPDASEEPPTGDEHQ